MDTKKLFLRILPYGICILFFIAYSILSVVRHQNYGSYGYDLGINDQVVWRYAHLELPINTIAPYVGQSKFTEHVELVFVLLAPFYWIWSSPVMLLLLQAGVVCVSALVTYLLSRKYLLSQFVSLAIMLSYLMFYGVQFGLWTDVHSSVFAAAFLMFFIYFLDTGKKKLTFLFFLLTLTAKESTGTALFFIALIYLILRKDKLSIAYMALALLYTMFIYFVFFPLVIHTPYLYANHSGLLSNLNPLSLIDTTENRQAIFYAFASWGFLPILSPLILLPIISHFYKFFVIASDLSGAQGLFGQYRIMLAPVLALGAIWTIRRFGAKKQTIFGVWLLLCVFFAQYSLHLPLSYLSKQWFWTQPNAVKTINAMIGNYIPKTVSVVAQNNIIPHISQRDEIYTLYPEKKNFIKNSPCRQKVCDWFRWSGKPQYLLVDTSSDWDARHLFTDRTLFLKGLQNLEKAKVVTRYKVLGTTILYKIDKSPDE